VAASPTPSPEPVAIATQDSRSDIEYVLSLELQLAEMLVDKATIMVNGNKIFVIFPSLL